MRTSETQKDYSADCDPIAEAMNGIWIIIFIPSLAKIGEIRPQVYTFTSKTK